MAVAVKCVNLFFLYRDDHCLSGCSHCSDDRKKWVLKAFVKVIWDPAITPTPTSDQNVYHARTQAGKTPPFRGLWTGKTPIFQPKSLILRSNKAPLFKAKRFYLHNKRLSTLCVKARLIVSNIFSVYIVLFITSNLERVFRSNVWKPERKQADASKMFILFQNLSIYARKITPFLDFANSRQPWKNNAFLLGIRFDRGGGRYGTYHIFF